MPPRTASPVLHQLISQKSWKARFTGDRRLWLDAFRTVRSETERRAAHLSAEDQVVQSMPDASPTKWHRAHTTWFFEQFLLVPHAPDYRRFDERFAFLFNSYYVAAGPRHQRPKRGMLTRPGAQEVAAFRAHVDAGIERLIENATEAALAEFLPTLEIGLHHEQQHQELILTDILHAFAQNPADPVYDNDWQWPRNERGGRICRRAERHPHHRARGRRLLLRQRAAGASSAAAEDAHRARPGDQCAVARIHGGRRLRAPALWLSDGWATVEAEGWRAPGYWRQIDGAWFALTLGGLRPVAPDAPVCHVSYYEADAFARWAGKHLPSEAEWEVAARRGVIADAFGIVWQWTRSAYSPYPGYRGARRARRIQRQIHGQPDGVARQLAGHAGWARARKLSQFLLSAARVGNSPGCGSRSTWLEIHPFARTSRARTSVPSRRRNPRRDGGRKRVRNRRDRRLDHASQAAAAEIFLRRERVGAVRAHHRTCRNIIRPAPSSASSSKTPAPSRRCSGPTPR